MAVLARKFLKNSSNTPRKVGVDFGFRKTQYSPARGLKRLILAFVGPLLFWQRVPVISVGFNGKPLVRERQVNTEPPDLVLRNGANSLRAEGAQQSAFYGRGAGYSVAAISRKCAARWRTEALSSPKHFQTLKLLAALFAGVLYPFGGVTMLARAVGNAQAVSGAVAANFALYCFKFFTACLANTSLSSFGVDSILPAGGGIATSGTTPLSTYFGWRNLKGLAAAYAAFLKGHVYFLSAKDRHFTVGGADADIRWLAADQAAIAPSSILPRFTPGRY
jgi:hypothetical protein